MKNRESIFDEGKRTIDIVLGIVLILFITIVFLSPLTSYFYGLSFISSFLVGFVGHTILLPFTIVFCVEKIIGYKKKKNSIYEKIKLFIFLLSIGLSFLITDTALDGQESLHVDKFIEVLWELTSQGRLGFNPQLGGGIFVYLVSGILTQFIGRWATITLSIVIMVISLSVLLSVHISQFINFIKNLILNSKKNKDLLKQERIAREKRENFEINDFQQHLFKDTFGNVPKLSESSVEEEVRETRYERNHLRRVSEPSSIKPVEKPLLSSEGLVPAFFGTTMEPASPSLPEVEQKEDTFELAKPSLDDLPSTISEEAPKEDYFEFKEEPQVDSIQEESTSESFVSQEEAVEPMPEADDKNEEEIDPSIREILKVHPKASPRQEYTLPGIDLLDEVIHNESNDLVEAKCLENESKINDKFKSLGVGAYVVSHTIGPSVTRYNVKTHDDVMVNSVQRCINDLSIKLGGVPIRFETLVRGSETSGLEVVNPVTTTVYFKEVYADLPVGPKYKMYFPFGKSIEGKTLSADLTDFPHMLVAGGTGSGKSVFLHQVILPLIMRNRPEDLKLLLIDPKHIEMGKYREIGHLLCPVVTDPIKARVALEKLAVEMERRYLVLDSAGGIDAREFNESYADEHGLAKMPIIVVVIDEFADLVESNRNVSELVLKIAQKARAAGIDLIIATQRPDVSVISGTIKANLQTRVALSMRSAIDSQTIIGQAGAEDLNGKGDMLIDCGQIDKVSLTRCQAALVTKNEIKRVTDAIKSQYPVQYDPAFLDLSDHSDDAPVSSVGETSSNGEPNNFYELVKSFIMGRDYASASSIQREFSIGYPRAGKMIDMLAKEGIIGGENHPENTPKGRKVLVHVQPTETPANGSLSQSYVIPEGYPQPGDE